MEKKKEIDKSKWIWMPHAGHLIVGYMCRFHLNTRIEKYIISTVGEYPNPEREDKFEEIGPHRLYETMVFPAMKSDNGCCPWTARNWLEIDTDGYNTAEDAYKGHLKMCNKYASK